MCPNMPLLERLVRVSLGLSMKLVPLFNSAAIFDISAVSIPVMLAGTFLLVTGLLGVCPIYRLFGVQRVSHAD